MATRWFQKGLRRSKIGRRWAQDGPRWAQDGPRWAQDGPKMAQDGPRWPQDGPKMGPRWVQHRSSKAFQHRSRKRETPGQSHGSAWVDFRFLLGPMLGPTWAPLRLIRLFKTINIRNLTCFKTNVDYRSDWSSGGSKRGPCWGHVGVNLASEGHLKTS